MTLGDLIIQARLGLTDEELVEQIKENPQLQLFIGLVAQQYSAPFNLGMMAYFRKRCPESMANDCSERIVRHGLNVISSRTNDHTGNGSHGRGAARQINQQIGSNTT